MKTFAIAGCGHLGKIVCKAYKQGLLEDYRLVASFSAQRADAQALVEGTDAKAASSMDEIISIKTTGLAGGMSYPCKGSITS